MRWILFFVTIFTTLGLEQIFFDAIGVDVHSRMAIKLMMVPAILVGFIAFNGYPIYSQAFLVASIKTKVILLSPFLWFLVVLLYVMIFEPYGSSMNNKDEIYLLQVMLLPPTAYITVYLIANNYQALKARLLRVSAINRLMILSSLLWILIVGSYVMVFAPYGRWMNDEDYIHMFTVMLFPIIILWIISWLYREFFPNCGDSDEKR